MSAKGPCYSVWGQSKAIMANHPHLAGLVLARGGSTGIPLKNLATLGDKSILEWALTAMNDNLCPFDSVWVSTDHDKIASCAENCQVSVFRRSPEFATADAPSIAAVQVVEIAYLSLEVSQVNISPWSSRSFLNIIPKWISSAWFNALRPLFSPSS